MSKLDPQLTLSQRKRRAILYAARNEFLQSGFRDTTMDRVASQANVSKRTVYNHFPTKEILFTAVASQIVLETKQAIKLVFDPNRSLKSQLREIAEQEIEHVTSNEYLTIFRLCLREAGNFSGLFDNAIAQTEGEGDPILNWIKAAMDAGLLKKADVELATGQFISLFKGKLFWPTAASHRVPPSKKERVKIIDGAVEMFLKYYAA